MNNKGENMKLFDYKKKNLANKSKFAILNTPKYSLITFLKNLRYLFKYNLKQMHNDPNINMPLITELSALKTKFIWDEIKVPKVKNAKETINELISSSKSIIRFGDGELNLMVGLNNLFEKYNETISKTFKEMFYKDEPNLLIGTYDDGLRNPKNFMWTTQNATAYKLMYNSFEKIMNLYNYDKTYYSSCFIFPFMYTDWDCDEQFNSIRKIWENKKVTIICGDEVFSKIKYNVFDNASDISYIYGPTIRAFEKYDELKEKVLNAPKDSILIFALGPCGKILAYDAFHAGYRVLDMGHLIKNYDFYKRYPQMSEKEFCREFKSFFKPDVKGWKPNK